MVDLPELAQISELIGKIYDASLDRRLWNSFLEGHYDPEQMKVLSTDLLSRLYGLSAAEARLCAVLFEAGSLGDALDKLGMSRNTAKTHLTHIFQKMGVSSQAQMLRQLATGFGLPQQRRADARSL